MALRAGLIAVLGAIILRVVDVQGETSQFKKTIPCAQLSDGIYVWGCNSFYSVCANGHEHTMQCYGELVLNPDNNKCDLPRNVWACQNSQLGAIYRARHSCIDKKDGDFPLKECLNVNKQAASQETLLTISPRLNRVSSKLHMQRNSAYTLIQSEPDINLPAPPVADAFIVNSLNAEMNEPQTLAEFDCAGKADGIYMPDGIVSCASLFWKCANGYTYEYICPGNLLYDPESQHCTQREFITACGRARAIIPHQRDSAAPIFDCTAKPDGLYETAPCPEVYFFCYSGATWPFRCSKGLVFDKASTDCVYPIECGVKTPLQQDKQQYLAYSLQLSQEVTPPTTTAISITTKAPFNCTGKPDGYYYKRKCKSSFIVCSKGQMSKQNCPQGLLFDPSLADCQYANICGKSTTTSPLTTTITLPTTTVTMKLKPDFNCTGKANGYYSKQPCTSTFYSCAHSYTIQLTCPPLLVFDPMTKICEYPNVCGSTIVTTPTGVASDKKQFSQLSVNSNMVVTEQISLAKTKTTMAEAIVTTTTPELMPSPFNCSNKDDGYYATKPCQKDYVTCISKKAYTATCQGGLVYDEINQFCNYPRNCKNQRTTTTMTTIAPTQQMPSSFPATLLITSSIAPPTTLPADVPNRKKPKSENKKKKTFTCDGKLDGIYMTKNCNNRYIHCWHNQTTRMTCPGVLVYDAITRTCEYKDACGKAKAKPVPADLTIPLVATTATVKIDFDCNADGMFEQGHCQQKYIICSNGKPHEHYCGSNLVYDGNTKSCEYVEKCGHSTVTSKSYRANEVDEDLKEADRDQLQPHYYAATSASLSSAFLNDAIAIVDDSVANEEENSNLCGQIPVGTHAIADCMSNYIICINGKIIFGSCSNGLVYDQNIGSCMPATKVAGCGVATTSSSSPITADAATNVTSTFALPKHSYDEMSPINQKVLKRQFELQ